jgi:trans-2,3-dihydro-3-hydroxyanthranilate isomerase
MSPDFFIVDVFAERAYAGNPLAVVLGAERLSDETMQLSGRRDQLFGNHLRLFRLRRPMAATALACSHPAREIAFAGHPILGTAWVIAKSPGARTKDSVKLNLQVGEIPVYFEAIRARRVTACGLTRRRSLTGIQCERERMALALGLAIG